MKRVLIIEDQLILSDLLSKIIKENPFFELLGRTDDGQTGLKLFEDTGPDIVVLDIGLPRLNGLEILSRIKKARPGTFVIMFTGRIEKKVIQSALKNGADSFLEKNVSLEELEKALDFARNGQPYFCATAMKVVRNMLTEPEPQSQLDSLTSREKEILQLIAEGNTNKEISSVLNLSLGTVNTHRWNLMRKLNIHDAASLTRFAIEQGLTSIDPA